MAIFRSYNDVIISFLEYLRLVQPDLDTKPGTVSRDLFVDSPAQQISELYTQLRNISNLQSFFSTNGSDLSKLASNFGLTKKTGTSATGVAVFTTKSLDVDILIPYGTVITANNGINFRTSNNFLIKNTSANIYKATASRLRTELDLASITDIYAVEVNVEALTYGTSGNIGPYSLITQSIPGISRVTNLQTFSGGSNAESDNDFRTRILSVFSGANTGTALGYTSAIESLSGVSDSIIIVPGDPLLIRDGTQTAVDINGNLIVSDPGSGGKVDIYILGSSLESQIDTFIYNDQSGKKDPTSYLNDVILGQRGQSTDINVSQRRVSLVGTDNLPYQPTSSISTVVGSVSGSNFVEKYTDDSGVIHGNYELVKDTGDFGGSSFGFDKLRWISDEIELDDEEITKGTFNGSDELDFDDVSKIRSIYQDIFVSNENSTVSVSDRSQITLKHVPIRSVNRVSNLTTGERYIVEDQNPDGESGQSNTTGKITISGKTLPVGTDVLQADYTWVKSFDDVLDFDNLYDYNVNRSVQNSVDWSFGNLIKNEPVVVVEDASGYPTVTVTHSIYKVISVDKFETETVSVSGSTISASQDVDDVIDVKRASDGAELFNTDSHGGVLSGGSSIILPLDSLAVSGDSAIMRYNAENLYTADGYASGTFTDNVIILDIGTISAGSTVLVNYVANVSSLIPENNISSLPAIQSGNEFTISGVSDGSQPTSNILNSSSVITNNLKKSSSHLRVNVNSMVANGSIAILGSTVKKVSDALVVVSAGTGYEIDLRTAILSDLGTSTIPSTVKIMKLYKVEKVSVDSSNLITSVDNTYDIVNYTIRDNSYDLDNALSNGTLSATKIVLPSTTDNTSELLITGDIVRVTFYYINTSDSEILYFSRSGEQISNKMFSTVTKVYSNYGFKNASSVVTGNVSINAFNQPVSNTSYYVGYNYGAPKENERITVTFNYNSLINTAVNTIESVRPITADVLVKEAQAKTIDVTIKVVILSEYLTQEQTVLQDATDSIIAFLTASDLGTTIDSSDLINRLYTVQGIDRVRVTNFSYGTSGNLLSISADDNEYLAAGTVDISSETR